MVPQPNTKLASLKLGLQQSQRIKILHLADENSEPIVLSANYPKDLAVALSPYVGRALNAVPLNQVPLSELKPKSNSVTINGGHIEAHIEVLRWILNCGEAGKTVNFRSFGMAFHQLALMALSCEQLQVAYLPAQLMTTMSKICAGQVHSVEVENIFTSIKGPHKIKTMVCESIATAMWECRCLAVPVYNALCKKEHMKEFADGLNAHYEKLEKAYYKTPEGKADLQAQQEKAEKRKANKKVAAERREENYKNRVARSHNVDLEAVTVTGKGSYTIKTESVRVRKAQGNKSGYVALDLGQMGVSPQNFRAKATETGRRQGGPRAAPAPAAATDSDKATSSNDNVAANHFHR